jgi:sirohydrochlorin ferrochelatase
MHLPPHQDDRIDQVTVLTALLFSDLHAVAPCKKTSAWRHDLPRWSVASARVTNVDAILPHYEVFLYR